MNLSNSGWQAAVADAKGPGNYARLVVFQRPAQAAEAAGLPEQAQALVFLAAICSMWLKPGDARQPMQPLMVMNDGALTMLGVDLSDDRVQAPVCCRRCATPCCAHASRMFPGSAPSPTASASHSRR